MDGERVFDVAIVGGGPAGLSAALVLGRCCRSVLLCDAGTPRSWASHEVNGYLGRSGVDPEGFRGIAREQLAEYANVQIRDVRVEDVKRRASGFVLELSDSGAERARKLLIATGVMDELPPLAGLAPLFGRSVHTCPYCDGWEVRGAPIAVYGQGRRAFEMARALTAWTADIAICSDGDSRLTRRELGLLARNGIALREHRIARLAGRDGQLEAIVFEDAPSLPRRALFFDLPSHPQARLVERLGCRKTRDGRIRRGRYESTSVPGVYVAGNILRDVQLAIVAAAEGARAAFGINRALTREDFGRRATGTIGVEHPPLETGAELGL